jgi:hypothetical protein
MDDNYPSVSTMNPSGINAVGVYDQINDPVSASTGATVQPGQQSLSGSDKNTPPGPPVFKWNKYDFCWNAYWGTGGFYDGTVLRKMLVELDDQYLLRRALTFYRNFFRQIIDATYKPVFSEGTTRTVDVNGVIGDNVAPIFQAFLDDADCKRNPLSQVVKRAVKNARILGVCFVVVDNYGEAPELLKDQIKMRRFPYIYLRLPQQVEEKFVELDEVGRLRQIAFKELPESYLNPKTGLSEVESRWKKWTANYSVKMRYNKESTEYEEIPGTMVEYGLGEIPVIPIMSSESEDNTVLPHPTFYDIARCNWAIFNWDSFNTRTTAGSLYPIMMLPRPSGTEVSNLQAVGPQQGIYVPPAENGVTPAQPQWLDYPTGCLEAIQGMVQDLVDDMFRQAGQQGVSAQVKSGAKQSGISKSYDFHGQQFVLKESAKMAKDCELEVARIFKLYVNEEFDFECHYEEDFEPDQDPSEDVTLYGDFIALDPGPKGKALALKMCSHSVFGDADPEDLAAVIAEIDQRMKDAEKDDRDMPPEDVPPDETPEQKAERELKEAEDAKNSTNSSEEPVTDDPVAKKKNVNKAAKRGYSLKRKGVVA